MPDKHHTAPNPSRATRRAAAALPLAALLTVLPDDTPLGAVPRPAAAEPDAELINLCASLIAAVDAYNSSGSDLECEDDPMWWRITEIEARIEALEAKTIPGIVALARVARRYAHQPDGSENWSDSHTGDWPAHVARAVLRLFPAA